MITKFKLTAILVLGITAVVFAQGRTPDFWLTLGKTNYFIDLSKGKAHPINDTVFYNLYRYGNTKRIGKEVKHIINKNTGDTIKSGSFETIDNRIFFYLKQKNMPTLLRLYTQNSKGLLTVQTSVSTFVAPLKPSPIDPLPPYNSTGHPEAVDIIAEFPGGMEKARMYIANNLQYPDEAQENEIEATVQAKFVIEKDGTLSNIQVEQRKGYGFDEEVIRVLKRMPKWKPAMLKGQPVRSQFRMPISFRLQ